MPDTSPVIVQDEVSRRVTAEIVPTMEPLHLEPPPQVIRPKSNLFRSMRVGGTTYLFSRTRWKDARICARTQYCEPSEVVYMPGCGGSRRQTRFISDNYDKSVERDRVKQRDSPYVVVGIWSNHHNFPRERLKTINEPETLFKQIRSASWTVRPLLRRVFSLKRVAAFGIYECNAIKGYHNLVAINHQTEVILADMFGQYLSGEPDYANRWLNWVQEQLNQGKHNPGHGKYAIQLVLRWSPKKVVLWGSASIILSLVIGFWYMFRQYAWAEASDYPGITQTAWTIASYIVTTAGVAIALLAAITQIGDV